MVVNPDDIVIIMGNEPDPPRPLYETTLEQAVADLLGIDVAPFCSDQAASDALCRTFSMDGRRTVKVETVVETLQELQADGMTPAGRASTSITVKDRVADTNWSEHVDHCPRADAQLRVPVRRDLRAIVELIYAASGEGG